MKEWIDLKNKGFHFKIKFSYVLTWANYIGNKGELNY